MKYNSLFESLDKNLGSKLKTRRYSLSDMISESYKSLYSCESGTNMQKLVESHLDDVRRNPSDIDRLSRQLSIIKEITRLTESGDLKDEDLVPKKEYDEVKPKKERAIDLKEAVLDPEDCRDEIHNAWSYGWKGTPQRQNNSNRDGESAIYKKYGIRSEDDIYDLDDDTARKMYSELDNLKESKDDEDVEETDDENLIDESAHDEDVEETEDEDLLEDTDLTDEEVEELTKHLEEIRKNKKVAECDAPKKKPVKESTKGRKLMRRTECSKSVREVTDPSPELQDMISTKLADLIYEFGVDPNSLGDLFDDLIYNIAKLMPETNESKSYSALCLSEFAKKSSSKAFVKTFKKLDSKLKEGTALTRQESISLYKAANSAMTHLSVELEHNPGFLTTFKESVSLLSVDVEKLLNSLKENKAPSKNTMRSLSKFVEALLREDEEEDLPPIEDEENEFIGSDEGEISSEDEDDFDQEYADARVELHKDLVDEHGEDEDPGVQDKLAQDAEEVVNLPGITDEQIAEITGEETPEEETEEEPAEEETPEEEVEEKKDEESEENVIDTGSDDITDDELAELKRHLTEMRKAKRK